MKVNRHRISIQTLLFQVCLPICLLYFFSRELFLVAVHGWSAGYTDKRMES